jgi:hypothetical protein
MSKPNDVNLFLESERKYESLYTALGLAVSHWALIELQLSLWFHLLTDIEHQIANDLFFSTTSFVAKADLIKTALTHSKVPDTEKEFVEVCRQKALTYSKYRNKFVHGGMHILSGEMFILDFYGAVTFEKFEGGITVAHLNQAAANFHALMLCLNNARLIYKNEPLAKSTNPPPTLATLLAQVRLLPNEADSPEPTPKQLDSLRQSKVDREKNARKQSRRTGH